MTATFFGQYLQIKGLVSSDQLARALEFQAAHNHSLGQLALEQGWLNDTQGAQINLHQRSSDMLFGELAIYLGWLSKAQVDQLLEQQRRSHMTLGRALTVTAGFDDNKLHTLLADYHYWYRRNQRECNKRVAESSFALQIDGFTDLLERQLKRVFGLCAHTEYVRHDRPDAMPDWAWRLEGRRYKSLLAVLPTPAFMQAVAERQQSLHTLASALPGKVFDDQQAERVAEDFFDRLVQELSAEVGSAFREVLQSADNLKHDTISGPAQESLCVGYSVEGNPLQVYFCAA
ncbi:hypothetical protein [Gilvimarinus sp. DA14]|uniref:hypothetical protein n=1 Tax=Gilvimarinus sp. DA14 TaxID=2956798 RepID=UPI0020B8BCC2|nr:hypothetical protein [Gilvimarinus sp. DA14]UTF60977.1 hypothetical protein NHM04_04025 [Gilvimarinus sp. DA14]